MVLDKDTKKKLQELAKDREIYLSGNILKIIDSSGDDSFKSYIEEATKIDNEIRRKRLDVTKQIQIQNRELISEREKNRKLMEDLETALEESKLAKQIVETDLDNLQKKIQTELTSTIVKVALFVIIGVGGVTTGLYVMSILLDKDTTLIGNTWSNLFGILLTNCFSIIGTIMGIKYANDRIK